MFGSGETGIFEACFYFFPSSALKTVFITQLCFLQLQSLFSFFFLLFTSVSFYSYFFFIPVFSILFLFFFFLLFLYFFLFTCCIFFILPHASIVSLLSSFFLHFINFLLLLLFSLYSCLSCFDIRLFGLRLPFSIRAFIHLRFSLKLRHQGSRPLLRCTAATILRNWISSL